MCMHSLLSDKDAQFIMYTQISAFEISIGYTLLVNLK